MQYQVRNEAGTLNFENLLQVEQAWRAGLIAPDDEIREVVSTQWCQVRSWPPLGGAKHHAVKRVWMGFWLLRIMTGIVGSIIALVLLNDGRLFQTIAGAIVALVTAGLLLKMTMNTHVKRTRRPSR